MIRQPETRAHRRAVASLTAYRQDTRPLSRNRHSDALAGHLEGMVGENWRLRADLLAERAKVDALQARWDDLKTFVGGR